jgi:hypothetical protein
LTAPIVMVAIYNVYWLLVAQKEGG